MIISGFTFLVTRYEAAHLVQSYTLDDMWFVAKEKQISEVSGSVTLILTFFRLFYYLTPWEVLGILIITIFKMFMDIVKFLIIFVLMILGFASAFYLSSGTGRNFYEATVSLFLSSTSGYSIPESGSDILNFAENYFSTVVQIVFVFTGIILLLNLLIALMAQTYDDMHEQATREYRWLMTTYLRELHRTLWPAPLCVPHLMLGLIAYIFFKLRGGPWKYEAFMATIERVPKSLISNKEHLFGGMVTHYYKENFERETYMKCFPRPPQHEAHSGRREIILSS